MQKYPTPPIGELCAGPLRASQLTSPETVDRHFQPSPMWSQKSWSHFGAQIIAMVCIPKRATDHKLAAIHQTLDAGFQFDGECIAAADKLSGGNEFRQV